MRAQSWLAGAAFCCLTHLGMVVSLQGATWEAVSTVMQDRCVSCHGPTKVKGGLRLDTIEMLRVGGKNGPAVYPGEPERSSLYTLCVLEEDDPDRMPGRGEPLTPEQIQVIHQWIAALPSWEEQAKSNSDGFVYQDPWQALSSHLGPVPSDLIAAGKQQGLIIDEPLPGLLAIDAGPRGKAWSDTDAEWLRAVAPHVVSLDLFRCQLTAVPDLSALVNLRHLQLRGNQITSLPASLPSVDVLNVAWNPQLPAKSLQVLADWPRLQRVHIAGTAAAEHDQVALPQHVKIVR